MHLLWLIVVGQNGSIRPPSSHRVLHSKIIGHAPWQFTVFRSVAAAECLRVLRVWLTHHRPLNVMMDGPSEALSHMTKHYDVIISAMPSQITSLTIVYSSVYSDADQRKHQSSASQAFVWGMHRWAMNSPHKAPVTRKRFPFDDGIVKMLDKWGIRLVLSG